jgi:hypothetical protein
MERHFVDTIAGGSRAARRIGLELWVAPAICFRSTAAIAELGGGLRKPPLATAW